MSVATRVAHAAEGVRVALGAMAANKLRSALTVLGVLIGVTTVMAMASLIQGINNDITSQLETAGPTTFYVVWWFNGGLQVGRPPPEIRQRPFLTKREADALNRLPDVEYAAMYGITNQRVGYKGDQTRPINVYGAGRQYVDIDGGTMLAGRIFTLEEERIGSPVVVIYEEVADRLFGREDPINKVVRIGTRGYRVIGVYRKPNNLFASDTQTEVVFIPFESLRHNFRMPEEQNAIAVRPRPGVTVLEAQDEVTREMRRLRGLRISDKSNFDMITQAQILDTWNKLTSVFFLVMLVLAGVSLMVGGLGVTAIMMVSVTERTKEIGLRKALGARRADILWQFLVEAATLTLLGGVAGMILGGGLALLVGKVTPIPAVVPLWSVVTAIGASIAVGIVFGVIPANRAARLDPIEALRHE